MFLLKFHVRTVVNIDVTGWVTATNFSHLFQKRLEDGRFKASQVIAVQKYQTLIVNTCNIKLLLKRFTLNTVRACMQTLKSVWFNRY